MRNGTSSDASAPGVPLPDRTLLAGSLAAVTAYGVWGIAPIDFHWLGIRGPA